MTPYIIEGIAKRLHENFSIPIFENGVAQGLDPPCFLITLIRTTFTKILDLRYFLSNSFDIIYFPAKVGDNKKMIEIGNQLLKNLEYIELDDEPVKGVNEKCEIVDSTLHFFVNYNAYLRKDQIKTEMLNLTQNFKVAGDDQTQGIGTFTAQNKVLPEVYINFVTNKQASSVLGARGVAALIFTFDW